MNKYDVVMGIEIHCELKTKTKCFSSAANTFGQVANSQVSAIDCGYPGTLPALNQEVVISAIKTCAALKMDIDCLLRFDRKNYFYPDLAKGYQITQFYHPIGSNGNLKVIVDDQPFIVALERLHIEEDTAKQIHEHNYTLLDYNRAGIALLEIVTKPIFTTSNQVIAYLTALRQILIYLDVSDAKMNEGSFRCDINISLKTNEDKQLGTKVEIKNLNSFNNITLAINDEIVRQTKLLNKRQKIILETRRFDETTNKTISMRSNANQIDYKYFREPNIFPIELDSQWVNNIIKSLPPLPNDIANQLLKNYNLKETEINILIENQQLQQLFEATVAINNLINATINYLLGPVKAYFNANNLKINETKITASNLAQLITLITENKVNDQQSKIILAKIMTDDSYAPLILIKKLGLTLITDEKQLIALLESLLKKHHHILEQYQTNPTRVIKFFMGQLMKISKGQASPQIAEPLLKTLISNYQK